MEIHFLKIPYVYRISKLNSKVFLLFPVKIFLCKSFRAGSWRNPFVVQSKFCINHRFLGQQLLLLIGNVMT